MMKSIIISGEKEDVQLLGIIAERLGLSVLFIKENDIVDFALGKAIIEGETGEFIDTAEFIKSKN